MESRDDIYGKQVPRPVEAGDYILLPDGRVARLTKNQEGGILHLNDVATGKDIKYCGGTMQTDGAWCDGYFGSGWHRLTPQEAAEHMLGRGWRVVKDEAKMRYCKFKGDNERRIHWEFAEDYAVCIMDGVLVPTIHSAAVLETMIARGTMVEYFPSPDTHLRAELEAAKKRAKEAEAELDRKRQEVADAEYNRTKADEACIAAKKLAGERLDKLACTRAELDAANAKVGQLQSQLADAHSECNAARRNVESIGKTGKRLQRELDAANARLAALDKAGDTDGWVRLGDHEIILDVPGTSIGLGFSQASSDAVESIRRAFRAARGLQHPAKPVATGVNTDHWVGLGGHDDTHWLTFEIPGESWSASTDICRQAEKTLGYVRQALRLAFRAGAASVQPAKVEGMPKVKMEICGDEVRVYGGNNGCYTAVRHPCNDVGVEIIYDLLQADFERYGLACVAYGRANPEPAKVELATGMVKMKINVVGGAIRVYRPGYDSLWMPFGPTDRENIQELAGYLREYTDDLARLNYAAGQASNEAEVKKAVDMARSSALSDAIRALEKVA